MIEIITTEIVKGLINAGFLTLGGTLAFYLIRKMLLKTIEKNELYKEFKKFAEDYLKGEKNTNNLLNLPEKKGGEE